MNTVAKMKNIDPPKTKSRGREKKKQTLTRLTFKNANYTFPSFPSNSPVTLKNGSRSTQNGIKCVQFKWRLLSYRLSLKNLKQMTASVRGKTNQNTQEVKMNAI